ncbi:hypothetical protein ACIBHX_31525 [Nonomuraea sp. NPDC050536]|uniref:hypothetical protein n=1 Tax=Nonomuraea sp. NPDC050536 TaxID=3364366 RepID=UPI0037CA9887
MRAKVVGTVAVVSVLAGCGSATSVQPSADAPGVLSVKDAKAPTPGGEVGSASDEFDDPAHMSVWSKLSDTEKDLDRIDKYDIDKTVKGSLYLQPKTSSWFDGFRGPFVYQDLAGDIVMYARVKVTGKQAAKPKRKFSLGGLMARVPNTYAKAGWFSITTGTSDVPSQVEAKITKDGSSKPGYVTVKGGWLDLVLARVGRAAAALYREQGGAWKVARRWPVDVPANNVMEWGVTAYTDWDSYGALKKDEAKANAQLIKKGQPDVKMSVDFVRFLRPELPDWADPLNTASVDDQALIKALTPAGA